MSLVSSISPRAAEGRSDGVRSLPVSEERGQAAIGNRGSVGGRKRGRLGRTRDGAPSPLASARRIGAAAALGDPGKEETGKTAKRRNGGGRHVSFPNHPTSILEYG